MEDIAYELVALYHPAECMVQQNAEQHVANLWLVDPSKFSSENRVIAAAGEAVPEIVSKFM